MYVSLYRLQLKKYALLSHIMFCRESNFVANKRFLTQIFSQKKQILLGILSKEMTVKPLISGSK